MKGLLNCYFLKAKPLKSLMQTVRVNIKIKLALHPLVYKAKIMDKVKLKQQAAEKAVEFVESGMVIGLGHGSTAIFAVKKIAQLFKDGQLKDIVAIPCSLHIKDEAEKLGIPLANFDTHPIIDVTIDGADEVDPNLNVIKGGGGGIAT